MLRTSVPRRLQSARVALACLCAGIAASVQAQSTVETPEAAARRAAAEKAAEKAADAAKDGAVLLTPFQVSTSKDSGYFAENTLAGSRLNTNLADLAASITVVTKQQMDDTASLDINDVFNTQASTEGSASYTPSIVDRGTAKDSIAGYSFGNNGDSSTNAQANRVRGLAAPDAAIDIFRPTTASRSTPTTPSRSKSPRAEFPAFRFGHAGWYRESDLGAGRAQSGQ